jgi:hypothetical protein
MTEARHDVEFTAATEAVVSGSATDEWMSIASSVGFDEVTPEASGDPRDEESIASEPEAEEPAVTVEQASDAQTDAEPQADGDAEQEPETEPAPILPKREPETVPETVPETAPETEVETAPATEVETVQQAEPEQEPVMEPALPATQAVEPLVLDHELPVAAEAPTWAARITVREFFATLGSARAPSGVSREEAAQPEAGPLDAAPPEDGQLGARSTPEAPAAPAAEDEAVVPVGASEDAFSRLFADAPVSPEDHRAAAALSGALAHEPDLPSIDTPSVLHPSREPVSTAGRNEPPQESEEDLRRFREWLDGLTES